MDRFSGRTVRLLLLLALVCVGVGCSGGSGNDRPDPRAAPDFTLTGMDGAPLHLADYRGKVVLIHFWATWCAPCRAAMPHEMALLRKYGSQGLVVLGLSLDRDAEEVRDFLDRQDVTYPVALVDEATRQAYGGVPTVPLTVLIDREGRIRKKQIGFTLEGMTKLENAILGLLAEGGPQPVPGS